MEAALPAISPSRLEAWERCPFAYRIEYVDKIPLPPADQRPRLVGEAAHAILERYCRESIAARRAAPLERIGALARELAARRAVSGAAPGVYQEAQALVASYLRGSPLAVTDIAAVELSLALTVDGRPTKWEDPEAWLRGRIDVLRVPEPKAAVVLDWKSGWVADGDELRRAWAPGLYTALVRARAPRIERVAVEYQSLRSGHRGRIELAPEDVRERLDWAREVSRTIGRALDAREDPASFPPRPSSACAWCPWPARCPAGKQAIEALGAEPVRSEAEARHLAGLLLAGEARLAQLRERLKAFLSERPPLTLNGLQVGWFSTMGEFAPAAVIAALEALGEDPAGALMANRTHLGRLFRRYPGLEERLAPARTPSAPWFGHKKAAEAEP